MVPPLIRRTGRWLSPTTLLLAGLCFVLPFVSVACDTPGGFGRAAPGGTTSYNGIALAVGGQPDVSPPDKLRRPRGEDRLPPQPAALAALVGVVAATACAVAVSDRRVRRAGVAALAGATAVALLVNQALVEAELTMRVAEQLTGPLPAGKTARDFVRTGPGFGLCLVLVLATAAGNAMAWWRARRGLAPVAADGRSGGA